MTRRDGARVSPELEALVCEVLREAVRNAFRHGRPSDVSVGITVAENRLAVSAVSDGAGRANGTTGLGLGLRLASSAAAQHGGTLEWGPEAKEERWNVRLTVPLGND